MLDESNQLLEQSSEWGDKVPCAGCATAVVGKQTVVVAGRRVPVCEECWHTWFQYLRGVTGYDPDQ